VTHFFSEDRIGDPLTKMCVHGLLGCVPNTKIVPKVSLAGSFLTFDFQ
jgi:hypothetical protein